jgi:hypothetical protein
MTDPDSSDESSEERSRRWKELLERFDTELRDANLSDDEREQLVQEVLDDD